MKRIASIVIILIAIMLASCGNFSQKAYGTVIKSNGTYADYDSLREIINDKSPSTEKDLSQTADTAIAGSASVAESTAEYDAIVYWTDGGSVWHTDKACTSLSHSVDIRSGTVEEANAYGKSRACKRCS